MTTQEAQAAPEPRVRTRGLIACLSFAALTGSVVAGLGNPIVLTVATERHVSLPAAQWTLIITLLVGVVGTPIVSRLADGRLKQQVLIAAVLVVAAGSLIGALVPTFPGLLAGRGLQGLGYALVPLTVSVARERLRGPVLDRTLGVLSTSVAVGVGIGNPISGLCVLLAGYRAAFGFAFLVSAAGAVWLWRRIPPSDAAVRPVRLDLPGAVLLGTGLGAVLLAVARADLWGWASAPVLSLAVAGLGLLAVWVAVELRLPAPLVDLRLACARGILGANVAALLLGVTLFGGMSAVVLLIQRPPSDGVGFGYSVFVTGLLTTPMALATLVSPPVARALARRVGEQIVLPIGATVAAAAFGTFSVLHTSTWHIALAMALMGVGVGISYSAMPLIIVARTPPERTASATGTNQVLRLMGGSVGAAVVAAVLAAHTAPGAEPAESGYLVASLVMSAVGLLAAVAGWLLVPRVQPTSVGPHRQQLPLTLES
jgi:MFS family permease